MNWDETVNRLLWKVVRLFKNRVDVIHVDHEPYLLRLHIKHCGILPGIYLHHFYTSDGDRFLHNHPWKESFSLILAGGYTETRLDKESNETYRLFFDVGNINHLTSEDFHRVSLNGDYGWSLFVSRNEMQVWGFWDPSEKRFVPHYEYLTDSKGNYVTDLEGFHKELTEG